MEIVPRPNAALVGASAWPAGLDRVRQPVQHRGGHRPAAAGADLSAVAGWAGVDLPEDTDLALAVVPAERSGAADRWYLFSPVLRQVTRLDAAPQPLPSPRWSRTLWGFSVVDSTVAGAGVVVEAVPGGPAAAAGLQAGDRVVAVGGREVAGAAEIRRTLGAASAGRPIEIGWRTPAGESLSAELRGQRSAAAQRRARGTALARCSAPRGRWWTPWLRPDEAARGPVQPGPDLRLVRPARGGGGDLAPGALGRSAPGVGEGTRRTTSAATWKPLGREDEAVEAYRAAAASEATVLDDAGPPVAPAARDRLADLGVVAQRSVSLGSLRIATICSASRVSLR